MLLSVSNETLVVSFHVNYRERSENRELSVFSMLRHKQISFHLKRKMAISNIWVIDSMVITQPQNESTESSERPQPRPPSQSKEADMNVGELNRSDKASENNYIDNVNEVGRKEPSYRDASNETLRVSQRITNSIENKIRRGAR